MTKFANGRKLVVRVAAAVFLLWCCSGFFAVQWGDAERLIVLANGGVTQLDWVEWSGPSLPPPISYSDWSQGWRASVGLYWFRWMPVAQTHGVMRFVFVPFWPVVVLVGVIGYKAYRRGGGLSSSCTSCGYDKRGLTGSRCPDCGVE